MMKKIKMISVLCMLLLLCGCGSSTAGAQPPENGQVSIGNHILIDPPEQLTLFETNDVLAADGLYYATWTGGASVPYTNSDGEAADLYDVQLYLLASESPNEDGAVENCNSWLLAAKDAYEISSEKTLLCNDISYTVLTYTCTGDTTPYDRGISAFAVQGTNAVCIELTCVETYDKELEPILTDFLDGCHFENDENRRYL